MWTMKPISWMTKRMYLHVATCTYIAIPVCTCKDNLRNQSPPTPLTWDNCRTSRTRGFKIAMCCTCRLVTRTVIAQPWSWSPCTNPCTNPCMKPLYKPLYTALYEASDNKTGPGFDSEAAVPHSQYCQGKKAVRRLTAPLSGIAAAMLQLPHCVMFQGCWLAWRSV